MPRDDFATFILSHGRPNNVKTYSTLRKHGYTGKIHILIDDEDKFQDEYKKLYGSQVIVFDKKAAALITDAGDNFEKRNSVIYARIQNFIIAKDMGLKYFLQLDDDYKSFQFSFDENRKYMTARPNIKDLDRCVDYCLEFLENSGFDSVAFSQGGDYLGGPGSTVAKNTEKGLITRKVMNSFFFSVERPIKFLGRMNDDVNMYISNGNKGKLFGTIGQLRLEQAQTQENEGGLTEMYLELGTYVKSFYSVMYQPSFVKIKEMGVKNRRLHHQIKWNNAVPKIISEEYRKQR